MTDALSIVGGLISGIRDIIEIAVPIAFGAAVLGFFYGLPKYIFGAGGEKAQEGGKSIMKWGLIVLFIMASIYGIIRIIQVTVLGGNSTETIRAPRIDIGGSRGGGGY